MRLSSRRNAPLVAAHFTCVFVMVAALIAIASPTYGASPEPDVSVPAGFLFQVTKGTQEAYVFGSLHYWKRSYTSLSASLQAVIHASPVVSLEVNPLDTKSLSDA